MDNAVTLRKQLAARIKQLRSAAHLNQQEVAGALYWHPSKIIRMEGGSSAFAPTDVRVLVEHLGLTDRTEIDQLVEKAAGTRTVPYGEFKHVLKDEAREYFSYEAVATVIRQADSNIVPGLLQTPAYTRALLRMRGKDEDRFDDIVETRRLRQQILDDTTERTVTFLLDEAVLYRQVGGATVLRAQLDKIRRLVEKGTVSVRIVPFAVGANEGMLGPFVHLEFQSPDMPNVVYLENARGGTPVFGEEPSFTDPFLETFFSLEERTDTPEQSLERIARAIDGLPARDDGE